MSESFSSGVTNGGIMKRSSGIEVSDEQKESGFKLMAWIGISIFLLTMILFVTLGDPSSF
jgi:hypothetical protein